MAIAESKNQALVRAVDLNIGESQSVQLCDGSSAMVKLVTLHETRDAVRDAVRVARVSVEVNGKKGEIISGNYELPLVIAGIQIDSPITKGYLSNAMANPWALEKDVRLRLWPGSSPLMAPGTFVYPVTQKWFAGPMQTGNEPVYVDGAERPVREKIYYHDGLDFGGAEGQVEILSATEGVVIISGEEVLAGEDETESGGGYDRVVVRDQRGWYADYDHVLAIEPGIKPGVRVKMGQKLGLLGKEGGSGGWSHLHFAFKYRQPSGRFGTEPAYCYAWEAWQRQHQPELIAVARPHRFGVTGEAIDLDGSRSWSKAGHIASYEWKFGDGGTATGARVRRTYDRPGVYSEILQVKDAAGRTAYDFAVVEILNRENLTNAPPGIHASFFPTIGIKAGDPVTFQVRSFNTRHDEEHWDFGDGTTSKVKSDGNAVKHAKDGYARTLHQFAKPGNYIVTVQRENERGEMATARLWVEVA
jgi:murein DD-endopeptidase MepM/ murein hydrolase activator NlpD